MRLAGRVTFVSGGGSDGGSGFGFGFGVGACARFISEGARVVVVDIEANQAESGTDSLHHTGRTWAAD